MISDSLQAIPCSEDILIELEIWNHDGSEYIIGDWGDREDTYRRSVGWDRSDYPFPKKFDIKLIVYNNVDLIDTLTYPIRDWMVSIRMKFKVGQNQDSAYPLNTRVVEDIPILDQRIITKEELTAVFYDELDRSHHEVETWIKDIELESYHNKFLRQNFSINQIIFDIYITDREQKESCHYEHIFFMQTDE